MEFLRPPGPENKQDGTCAAEEHLPQHRHRAAGRRRMSASLRGRGARSGAKAAGSPRSAAGPPAVLWHCGVRTRRPPCGPRQGPSWAAGAGPVGRSPAERRHSTWRQPLLTGRARHPRGFGFRPELRHFAWEPRASAGCVRRKPHGRPRCQARRLLQPSPSQLPAGQRPGRRLGGLEKQGPFWNVENASEVHWDGCEVAVWEGRLVQDAEAPAPAPVLRPVPRG